MSLGNFFQKYITLLAKKASWLMDLVFEICLNVIRILIIYQYNNLKETNIYVCTQVKNRAIMIFFQT